MDENEKKVIYDESWRDLYKNTLLKAIPAHEDTHFITVCMLENFVPEEASLLAAGVGTGLEAICACSLKPAWTVTGFDPSEKMIQEGEEKVHALRLEGRIRLYTSFADGMDENLVKYDGAMSFYVYHYLKTKEERINFLKKIRSMLRPKAPFALVYTAGKYGEDQWANQLYSASFGYASHRGLGPKKTIEKQLLSKGVQDVVFLDEKEIFDEFTAAGFVDPRMYLQVLLNRGYVAFNQ